MLYITTLWLIYYITRGLYLLILYTYFVHPPPPSLLATSCLFSVSAFLLFFVLFCLGSTRERSYDIYLAIFITSLPGGSGGKASACSAGEPGSIPGSGRFPRWRNWQPPSVLFPRKFHGWRSLVGYSPWSHKESEATEQLHYMPNN